MASENFGLKIGLEGEKEFKSQLADINQSFKVLRSEMDLVNSQFDKNDTSVEALTAKNQVLDKSIEEQKKKIDTLKAALQNAAESFGENDKRTQSWQIQLNKAQSELNGMEKELKNNNDALSKADKGMDQAGSSAKDMGKEIKDSGEQAADSSPKFEALGDVCKAVGATMATAFAAVTAAAVAAGKALVECTTNAAAYADDVLTTSTVTGIATDKLQGYMYAAELVDVATDTLTKSMAKQIKSMKAVQDGTKLSVEAYEKLGVEVMNADGTLRDSDEVYWEVIDALGKIDNETERDALAMQILGKSAQELNPLIEAGAERMNELAEEAENAGYVLSDDMLNSYGALDDQIQYLNNNTTALKNALGTVLLPLLTDLATEGNALLGEFTKGIRDCNGDITKMADVIADVLPEFFNGIMKYVPEIMNVALSIVLSLIDGITANIDLLVESASTIVFTLLNGMLKALPKLTSGAMKLISSLVKGLIANLPMIAKAAIQLIEELARGIASAIPTLIPAVVEVITQLVQMIVDNLPMILEVALLIIQGLADGILDALPILLEALPQIIVSLVDFIIGAIPQIIDAGIKLLTSLVSALPTIVQAIVEAIPVIIDGILNAIVQNIPLLIDAGVSLLTALVQNLPTIIFAIVNAIPDIVTAIINCLTSNIPLLIQCGIELFTALIKNLPKIIVEIVKAVPEILNGLIDAFSKGFSRMADVGKNLVRGLWEGIQSLSTWIWDKVSGWASDLWGGICDFFGIHSPSKKMAWIGDMMMEGLAGGIDESSGEVIDSANSLKKDLNNAFEDLGTEMGNLSGDFRVSTDGINAKQTSGLVLQLNISNFNNYSSEDIQSLTEEIMEVADSFAKRNKLVFG